MLWFHAFDRDSSAADVVRVLTDGPEFHPNPRTTTRQNETRLGIHPHCVYAYLGRTIATFGKRAVVLPFASVQGHMSPFDTGGLIKHIAPHSKSNDKKRSKYLKSYTWSTRFRRSLVAKYPTIAGDSLVEYLKGRRPKQAGPHVIWPKKVVANTWSLTSNGWRAWTWEARIAKHLPVTDLNRWTCSPGERKDVFAEILKLPSPSRDKLLKSYFHGGVSVLVDHLRMEQAT